MKVTASSFFQHYIINPFAPELANSQKVLFLALSILIGTVTFGVFHVCAYVLERKRFSRLDRFQQRHAALTKLADQITAIQLRTLTERPLLQLSQVPDLIQQHFIDGHYAQPLPSKEDVTVPFRGERRRWSSLTRDEKIIVNNTGTRAHNQLGAYTPELVVDAKFFAHGQAPFITGDPRQSHGNDHCARVAIFSAIFAYLYHKYHPTYVVSETDVALCQLLGAGHDAGRQTEGPDVYDADSADITTTFLRGLGFRDRALLDRCHEAIADKDSDPLGPKSLLAKCVQNADSADFTRLTQYSAEQKAGDFAYSRGFLDIFKELRNIAETSNHADPSKAVLKGGLTFKDFCFELDALRVEMNDFTFRTHQRAPRIEYTHQSHYYNQVVKAISPAHFPLLHAIGTQIGVIPSKPVENPAFVKAQRAEQALREWDHFGLEKIGNKDLRLFKECLEGIEHLEAPSRKILRKIDALLSRRLATKSAFSTACAEGDERSLITTYYQLPFVLKSKSRKKFLEAWESSLGGLSPLNHLKQLLKDAETSSDRLMLNTLLVDFGRLELDALLDKTAAETASSLTNAKKLTSATAKLIRLYEKVKVRNPLLHELLENTVTTTASLAYEQASWIYQENGYIDGAKKALIDAATTLAPPDDCPFSSPGASPHFLEGDCGFVRRRKIRLAQKNVEGTPMRVISFELPTWGRERLQERLKLLQHCSHSLVTAQFMGAQEGVFSKENGTMTGLGKDIKINLTKDVTIYVGADQKYWNNYVHMRVETTLGLPLQKVHEALSQLGLPMALMTSRKKDRRNQALASALAFHYPQIASGELLKRQDPHVIFESLNEDQQAVITRAVKTMRLAQVGPGHFELSAPSIPGEAWRAGARCLATFVATHGSFAVQATMVGKILRTGFLSSQERFQRGLLGYGCVPSYNYQTGSGNQVFTRLFTKNIFDTKFSINDFPVNGPIMFLLDLKALERQPFGYVRDYGGMRNPHYFTLFHDAQKQAPIRNLKGSEVIRDQRLNFREYIERLNKDPYPLNEVMFDQSLSADYIKRVVVRREIDKLELIAYLYEEGVTHVNGIPLDKAIITSDRLDPSMVDGFEEEDYSEETHVHSVRDGVF